MHAEAGRVSGNGMVVDVPGEECRPSAPGLVASRTGFHDLRVAIVTVGEIFGGVERHVLGLLDGLGRLGIAVDLALFHDRELAREARARGVSPVLLPPRHGAVLQAATSLASTLAEHRVRIVHVHGYKATVTCALARRLHDFATVKTEHGLPEVWGATWHDRLRTRAYHALDRVATRAMRAAVCHVTDGLRERHRSAYGGLRQQVIANGIDAPERTRLDRPAELCEPRFHAVIVGRVDEVKGHRDAIRAIADPRVDRDVVLHVVGSGPLETDLRSLGECLGVSSRLRFHGFRRDALAFIAHADALLMPSLHEGLPYVLIEAMALGTPIVASRVGGLAEALDEQSAWLVSPRDADAIAATLVALRAQPEVARERARAAQLLQRERYSLDAMAGRYAALYRALAGPRSQG